MAASLDGRYKKLNGRYQVQATWTASLQKRLLLNVLSRKKENEPVRVLEVGCGTGAVLSQMQSMTSRSIQFFGCDITLSALYFVHDALPVQAYGQTLPFSHQSFDLVFCHYFLMWTECPEDILVEMKRVCRVNGIVAALAEPDYGGCISFPSSIEKMTGAQARYLVSVGADVNSGRKLGAWFQRVGFNHTIKGVYGQQIDMAENKAFIISELAQARRDSSQSDVIDENNINGSETIFVPTFYCFAYCE